MTGALPLILITVFFTLALDGAFEEEDDDFMAHFMLPMLFMASFFVFDFMAEPLEPLETGTAFLGLFMACPGLFTSFGLEFFVIGLAFIDKGLTFMALFTVALVGVAGGILPAKEEGLIALARRKVFGGEDFPGVVLLLPGVSGNPPRVGRLGVKSNKLSAPFATAVEPSARAEEAIANPCNTTSDHWMQ